MRQIMDLFSWTAVSAATLGAAGLYMAAPALAAPALAAPGGDAVRGAKLFLQCRACHAVEPSEPSGTGPNLWGVVGSKAGSRVGYRYSPALSGSGVVWDAASLDQWLTRPTSLVAGTTMAFQGVAAPQSRADLIAYLQTLRPRQRKPKP